MAEDESRNPLMLWNNIRIFFPLFFPICFVITGLILFIWFLKILWNVQKLNGEIFQTVSKTVVCCPLLNPDSWKQMTNFLFEVFALWAYGMTPKTAIQVLSPRKYILYYTQVSQGVTGFKKNTYFNRAV